MRIWPAIDLRGGKCVRLRQGDYRRETVFGEDPAAMARHWASQGAECLHLVDLDGARSGQVENWSSIEAIVKAVPIPCELGGGVRDEATIQRLFDLGIDRVVIGTLALKQPDWFRQMCRKLIQRVRGRGEFGIPLDVLDDNIRRLKNLAQLIEEIRFWRSYSCRLQNLQQFKFIGGDVWIALQVDCPMLANNNFLVFTIRAFHL